MLFGNSCEQRDKCSYLHPNPEARRKRCFFGHGCKQKSRCSYLHPRSDEESSSPKEEVDIVSHVETKAAAVSTIEEAPLVVRDVNMLTQLQESDISPRLERSHSQVMENNAQFYGKNDVQSSPEDKKFLNFPEEMPLPIPSLFLKCSVPCPTSVKTPGNPEPKALNTLEMFVREMEHCC